MMKFTNFTFEIKIKKCRIISNFFVFFFITSFSYSQNFKNFSIVDLLSSNNTNNAIFFATFPKIPNLYKNQAEMITIPDTGKFSKNQENFRIPPSPSVTRIADTFNLTTNFTGIATLPFTLLDSVSHDLFNSTSNSFTVNDTVSTITTTNGLNVIN